MECLLLLQKFLKEFSNKNQVELTFEFEEFQENNLPIDVTEKLHTLNQCLLKIMWIKEASSTNKNCSPENKNKNIEFNCKLCRKRFSCDEIKKFHIEVIHEKIVLPPTVHQSPRLESSQIFIFEKKISALISLFYNI